LRPVTEKLLSASRASDGAIRHIKLNRFITVFPLRTETLPPATHTNCFIVGEKEFVVIDPGSPFPGEQNALHDFIDGLIEAGKNMRELILTHLHKDHISGAAALQKHLREKHGLDARIAGHRATAESVKDKVAIERFIEDGEIIQLESIGHGQRHFELIALHTPGHARGHLCFYDQRRGFLLSGDNVVGAGSVLIAPPEGNMKDYLNSLERMKNLPNLSFLCGAHGAAVYDAAGKIESYIRHRLERERKIMEALEGGAKTVQEIVRQVYTDVPSELWQLAEKSVAAHLEKLQAADEASGGRLL
jgi:glyoxylase-like metal-dependent hydrolase (beta-lactamase superfamily II)